MCGRSAASNGTNRCAHNIRVRSCTQTNRGDRPRTVVVRAAVDYVCADCTQLFAPVDRSRIAHGSAMRCTADDEPRRRGNRGRGRACKLCHHGRGVLQVRRKRCLEWERSIRWRATRYDAVQLQPNDQDGRPRPPSCARLHLCRLRGVVFAGDAVPHRARTADGGVAHATHMDLVRDMRRWTESVGTASRLTRNSDSPVATERS